MKQFFFIFFSLQFCLLIYGYQAYGEDLDEEGGYSCSFEAEYELTPAGITKKEGGSFAFIRTREGLFFNEINGVIGYQALNVKVWSFQDSFRFMNDRGTANFFYNNGMFFYTDTHIISIFAVSGFCTKQSKEEI